jgi:hypothetical protein
VIVDEPSTVYDLIAELWNEKHLKAAKPRRISGCVMRTTASKMEVMLVQGIRYRDSEQTNQ